MEGFTVSIQTHFEGGRRGRRLLAKGKKKNCEKVVQVSRLAKLMALAIKYDNLLQKGVVPDYAQLARLACVDRSLITRVMNLRLLAPEIQEQLLNLQEFAPASPNLQLKEVIPITRILDWTQQCIQWERLSGVRCVRVATKNCQSAQERLE